jgi:hypothetical protein
VLRQPSTDLCCVSRVVSGCRMLSQSVKEQNLWIRETFEKAILNNNAGMHTVITTMSQVTAHGSPRFSCFSL